RLIPNLGELRRLYPKLHLDVVTSSHAENLLGDSVDAAIIIASEVDEKLYSRRLDTNSVYAITSRSFAEQQNLTNPSDLEGQTVFVHSEMPETFEAWRREVGLPNLKPGSIDQMDSGPLMLEAAAQGLGIAIMHGSHFSDARDERLTRLFDIEVKSPYSYWFVCRPRALEHRAVRVFHDWLVRAEI
ncbi:MAG: LysR substrate-binding domain-containing protein, partial [Novosphingopyxis baekryungensis]|nr:LysR substrate-binding domain-containing protein [Novosphingopyxis baekryungensis]